MSDEKVEIARSALVAFRDEGVEGVLDFCPPDVVWYPYPEWVEKPVYRGHQGIREVTAVWTHNFDHYRMTWKQATEAAGGSSSGPRIGLNSPRAPIAQLDRATPS